MKNSREDSAIVECICRARNITTENFMQHMVDLCNKNQDLRDLVIERAQEYQEAWMEEHKIPSQESPEGRRYSLAHIIEAYGIKPLKFCEFFGLHYKALLEPGMTYFMTIDEMWDRGIYSTYLKAAGQSSASAGQAAVAAAAQTNVDTAASAGLNAMPSMSSFPTVSGFGS